jgi:hypothetical protein
VFKNKYKLTAIAFLFVIVFIPRCLEAATNAFEHKIKLIEQNNSLVAEKEFKLESSGCHDIGLYNTENLFNGVFKDSPKYQGDFILIYGYNNKIKWEKINQDAKIYTHVRFNFKYSLALLDEIEIPNSITSLHINLTINNPDQILLKNKSDIYLYVKKSALCGDKKKKIDDYWINSPEDNETLIPLYKALKSKNITKIDEFFNSTKLPYNVSMRGNRTALHFAAYFNSPKEIEYLLSKDITMLNKTDIADDTAFMYAIYYNNFDALKELLKYMNIKEVAKMRIKQWDITLPYHIIQSKKQGIGQERQGPDYDTEQLLEILLEAGMSSNILAYEFYSKRSKKYFRATMLDMAFEGQRLYEDPTKWNNQDYSQIIKILKKYGAKTYDELQEENIKQANQTQKLMEGK